MPKISLKHLDRIRERVEKQYVGGLSEIDAKKSLSNQTKAMFNKSAETDTETVSVFKPDDGKWRPVVLTLGKYSEIVSEFYLIILGRFNVQAAEGNR